MADKEVCVGDKFVLTIDSVFWSPKLGNLYFVEGWNNKVLTDDDVKGLEKYKEPPKEVPHTCEYCKYVDNRMDEMPCIICDKNVFEPRDMFEKNR